MGLEQRQVGNALVVKPLDSRLDAAAADEFKRAMTEIIHGGCTAIVLDMSGVTFVDSRGLGAIVSCFKLLGGNGNFAVSGVQPAVMSLFKLTRMDKVFRLFASAEEAVAAQSEWSSAPCARAASC